MKIVKKQFIIQVNKALEDHHSVKVNAVLTAEYVIVKDDEEIVEIKNFITKSVRLYSSTDLSKWFLINILQLIDADMEEFQERDSGWLLCSILNLTKI